MRYTYLILILSIMSNSNAFSQLKMGVRTNYSIINKDYSQNEFYNQDQGLYYMLKHKESKNCASYGIALYSDIGNLFFMSEFLVRKYSFGYSLESINIKATRTKNSYREETSELSIPIAAGISIGSIQFGCGPIFNFTIDENYMLNQMNGFSLKQRNLNAGFQFMIGIRLNNHLRVDLKREISFSKVGGNYRVLGESTQLKSSPHFTTLSIGLFI